MGGGGGVGEALTPTQAQHERDEDGARNSAASSSAGSNASAGGQGQQHYVPVVSTFSTSSRDFEIQHGRAMSTPALKIPAVLQGRRSEEGGAGRRSVERSGEER